MVSSILNTVVFRSPHSWNHAEPLLLVLPTQLFAVPVLLLLRPHTHLPTSDSQEDCSSPRSRDEHHTNPRYTLEEVVRTGDPIETKTFWYTTLSASWRSQTHQDQMRVQICQLSKEIQHEPSVRNQLIIVIPRRERCRGVDEVRNKHARQRPVVPRVLHDIERRHGGIAKAVNEQRLQLALEEVQRDGDTRHRLQVRRLSRGVFVDVRSEEVEEWVDEEWAEVFDDEDGSPCYL